MGKGIGLVDLINPKARRWWQEQYVHPIRLGMDCMMCDGGDGQEIPWDAIFDGKYTGREVHNLYPQLFGGCVYEVQQEMKPNQRVIIWIRTGFAGSQRYPMLWGGDQDSTFNDAKTLIRAGVNAGICGFPYWAQDSGGFTPNRTKEYYSRSIQWGMMNPIAMILGDPENRNYPDIYGNEPWVFGPEIEEIVRWHVKLRYRLLPYIYSYAVKAWHSGAPMMRAMPLEFPHDEKSYACDHQYMLGSELLIAPVIEASTKPDYANTRKVYLPAGTWYDFHTDRTYQGPGEIEVNVPFDRSPMFVRAGAIIPYGPDLTHIEGPPPAELTFHIYPGDSRSFELLEDDGTTLAYQRGEIACTLIEHREYTHSKRRVTIHLPKGRYKGMHSVRRIRLCFHNASPTAHVVVNGKPAVTNVKNGLLTVGPLEASGRVTVRMSE
jgi:alpha-glucosidase (family GH31 glycosyl hydrolase)